MEGTRTYRFLFLVLVVGEADGVSDWWCLYAWSGCDRFWVDEGTGNCEEEVKIEKTKSGSIYLRRKLCQSILMIENLFLQNLAISTMYVCRTRVNIVQITKMTNVVFDQSSIPCATNIIMHIKIANHIVTGTLESAAVIARLSALPCCL